MHDVRCTKTKIPCVDGRGAWWLVVPLGVAGVGVLGVRRSCGCGRFWVWVDGVV